MIKRIGFIVMVVGVYVLLGMPSVVAQTNVSGLPQHSGERSVYLTEEKLAQFHKVHKKVTKRSQKYHKKIKRAKREKTKLKLAKKAKRDILKIIEKSPLSVSEYNMILKVMLGRAQY